MSAVDTDGATSPRGVILKTKLRPPRVGSGWVPRSRLTDRLVRAQSIPLVLVDAPIGYGKTMLLAEWAAVDEHRQFAWLSLDKADVDPVRFFAHLVAAIRLQAPGFGDSVTPPLLASADRLNDSVLGRLVDELAELTAPMALVLDDFHRPRDRAVYDPIEELLERLPPPIQLVVATRSDPQLPLGRLRASRDLLEFRVADLRFDDAEARAMLEAAGVHLEPHDFDDLVGRTEGWPAGLYLAALSLRTEPNPGAFVGQFTGTHRHVADYLSEEVLDRAPEDVRNFLTRTSILERMCAPLCNAILLRTDSEDRLRDLERSNLFVVGLDDDRSWFRYHHLFAQMLEAELMRTAPDEFAGLHRRASEWYEQNGWPDEAVRHAITGGDEDLAGELVGRHWRDLVVTGHIQTVRRWIDELGHEGTARTPAAAIAAAWVAILSGDPDSMERWLATAEEIQASNPFPDGTSSVEAEVAITRGIFGLKGVSERRRAASRAAELDTAGSPWWPYIQFGLGVVEYLDGDVREAAARLTEALDRAPSKEALLRVGALSELAVARTELGDPDQALTLTEDAFHIIELYGIWSDPRVSWYWLARGIALRARGELGAAAEALEQSLEIRRSSGRLSLTISIQLLVALAPLRYELGDVAGARSLLAEAHEVAEAMGDAGDFERRIRELERFLGSARRLEFGDVLSDRELAVLRLLSMDLSQREIGSELHLSINTVKSHARAIYRKLGVTSRAEAVRRARQLELLA